MFVCTCMYVETKKKGCMEIYLYIVAFQFTTFVLQD